jgi:hypothetical protein
VLAEKNILGEVDYLFSVSGGGYFGTFLSSYLGRHKGTDAVQCQSLDKLINQTFRRNDSGVEAPAVRHLRNNSKYLLNGGPWGKLKVAGLMLSGIAANLSMVLPLALFGALAVWLFNLLGFWGGRPLLEKPIPLKSSTSPLVMILEILALLLLASWMVLLGTQRKAAREPPSSPWLSIRDVCSMITLALGVVTFLFAIASGIPVLIIGIDSANVIWLGTAKTNKTYSTPVSQGGGVERKRAKKTSRTADRIPERKRLGSVCGYRFPVCRSLGRTLPFD